MRYPHAYALLLQSLLDSPRKVAPRGHGTSEIIGHQFKLADFRDNVLVSTVRNPNYRFMIAEWLWILAGSDKVAPIARFNSKIAAFSDDGVRFAGAYGPKVAKQLPWAVRQLAAIDIRSRQAVIEIWRPEPAPSKDVPCTLALQFLVREEPDGGEALHLVANMRSSDAMLGVPYDVFSFTQIANVVASALGVESGSFTLNMGSSHLYDRDREKAAMICDEWVKGKTSSLESPPLEVTCDPSTGAVLGLPTALLHAMDTDGSVIDIPAGEMPSGEPWRSYALALGEPTSMAAGLRLERIAA